MEFIKDLPCIDEKNIYYTDDLYDACKDGKIICAKITEYDPFRRKFYGIINYLTNYSTKFYIYLDDYSIYTIKNPYEEIDKIVYIELKKFDSNLNMWKASRKNLLEKQTEVATYDTKVTAIVSSFYNEELAFCEFGAGLHANISLAKYLNIKKAANSIADVLKIGSTFNARIDSQYKKNFFALTTYKVEEYYFSFDFNDIIPGTVLARLDDDRDFRYSYWFMVTPRIIGIIKSDIPLGYGQKIKAKVHSRNDNFIKFRFNSYID